MTTISRKIALYVSMASFLPALGQVPGSVSDVQLEQSLHRQITKQIDLRYLLFLPRDYDPDGDREWPLIYFLHGAGERGTDLEAVKKHGPPRIVETRPEFPFLVLSPQCPLGEFWKTDSLLTLLDEVIAKHKVDRNRVYLTGLSMGGYGTWNLAAEAPERFAAIAPICGGGLGIWSLRLSKLPVWIFHGALDSVVPVEESLKMAGFLKRRGNDTIRLTIYPDADHDSWTETYNNPELYSWFLSHRRGAASPY